MSLYGDIRTAARNVAIKALEEYFPTSVEQNAGIIFSHTGGAEPSGPYVVINIINIEQQGHHSTSTLAKLRATYGFGLGWGEHYSDSDAEHILVVQVPYEVQIQFGFCGSLAGDMAQHFTQRINNNPWVFEELARNKLGVMRKSQIRRIPQKRDTKWVEYFNQDVTFSYIGLTEQSVDIIESVVLQDEYTGDVFTIPPGIVLP